MIRSLGDARIDAQLDRSRHARPGSPDALTPSPADWRDHWIYFLLLDRFDNPAAAPRQAWDAETFEPQGGTFAGVRRRLGYLCDLGVGALWISPFLKERVFCHGYGPQNFLAVDPRFGEEDELAELIADAHGHGLRVIADAVVHHAGDVFGYRTHKGDGATETVERAPSSPDPYAIEWLDEHLDPIPHSGEDSLPAELSTDAAVWPVELQNPRFFRRLGALHPSDPTRGDLDWLKELDPDHVEPLEIGGLRGWTSIDLLVRIYAYWIARLDLDGLRLDALKHLELGAARRLCTGLREMASDLGKQNFLLLGEVRDGFGTIARYLGRTVDQETASSDPADAQTVRCADSCLHFPFAQTVRTIAHDGASPTRLLHALRDWRRCLAPRIAAGHPTGGDPLSVLVTMLDDHDTTQRFHDGRAETEPVLALALSWLFTLPGIPCLYYGTEQGLHGAASDASRRASWLYEGVREALWGKPGAFDPRHPLAVLIRRLADLRAAHPVLRRGHTHWRPIASGRGSFHVDTDGTRAHGVVACSRLWADRELLLVASWRPAETWSGPVVVDRNHRIDAPWSCLFSSRDPAPTEKLVPEEHTASNHAADGSTSHGTVTALPVAVGPLELRVYGTSPP
ncbi:MAG: alpha-amylase family glycosyl hydrolase [Acidobacteriota bacterium]